MLKRKYFELRHTFQPFILKMLILGSLIVVLPGALKAQVTYGLRLGANLSNPNVSLSENPVLQHPSTAYKIGYQAGPWVRIPVSSRIHIINEFSFSHQQHEESDSTGQKIVIRNLSYSPLMRYEVTGQIMLELGPEISKVISAERKLDGDAYNIYESYKKGLDFGINVGVLYKFDLPLSVGIRYYQGFNDINEDKIPLRNEIGELTSFIDFKEIRRNFQINIYYRLGG